MAVSVILNGSKSNTRVSEATRQRILQVSAELNYSPNAMARGLKLQRTNTLGVLFNWAGPATIHSLFSMAVLDGIVAGGASAGYNILLYTEAWVNVSVSSASFSDRRADGIIVVTPGDNSDVIPSLVAMGVPVALLSSVTDVPGVPYSNIDNDLGMELAVGHLARLGHERIAYATQEMLRFNMRQRYAAFRDAMARRDLPVPDNYLVTDTEIRFPEGVAVSRLETLLTQPLAPTAIVAATDDIASAILESVRRMGISVPDELSVVGFDDILIASLTVPKLTTVRQPLYEMGRQVAWMLIERIEEKGGAARDEAGHIAVPELVVRASTAPPKPPIAAQP